QMILHEMCHALVEGERAWGRADWGLDNTGARDRPREEACLRLQAALLARYGLRRVLAPTAEQRPFYDGLGDDPLGSRDGVRSVLARLALGGAERPPFSPLLHDALAATAAIAAAAAPWAADPASLLARYESPPAAHAAGFPVGPGVETCGGCAWYAAGRC